MDLCFYLPGDGSRGSRHGREKDRGLDIEGEQPAHLLPSMAASFHLHSDPLIVFVTAHIAFPELFSLHCFLYSLFHPYTERESLIGRDIPGRRKRIWKDIKLYSYLIPKLFQLN